MLVVVEVVVVVVVVDAVVVIIVGLSLTFFLSRKISKYVCVFSAMGIMRRSSIKNKNEKL